MQDCVQVVYATTVAIAPFIPRPFGKAVVNTAEADEFIIGLDPESIHTTTSTFVRYFRS